MIALLGLIEKPLFLQDEGALVVPPAFAGDDRPLWAVTAASVLLTMRAHPCEGSPLMVSDRLG
ncbi:MAG TPA: hypothetical protein PLL88_02345 [Anaerolineaceae bacterium]|nr:hypothetical protein [Anaerolineaceae bacterium]